MREFKFRAWDMKKERMENITKMLFDPDTGKIDNIFLGDRDESRPPCEVVLMQYTGFKDKNGKEIYEGDIIIDDKKDLMEIAWGNNHQWVCKVIEEGSLPLGMVFPLWQQYHYLENRYKELEVVSNIYEW